MGKPRKQSESGLYHITSKGTGNQLIFEERKDRERFLRIFEKAVTENNVTVIAWCLMGNHFHLILQGEMCKISKSMKALKERYAKRFNKVHGRTGHLFQSVFASFPIEDECYLAAAVRYIHNNPVRAFIVGNASQYEWSSYSEYTGTPWITKTQLVLSITDGRVGFIEFSRRPDDIPRKALYSLSKMDDDKAVIAAKELLGIEFLGQILALEKPQRNDAVVRLWEYGMRQSQIARLIGLSKATISRIIAAYSENETFLPDTSVSNETNKSGESVSVIGSPAGRGQSRETQRRCHA